MPLLALQAVSKSYGALKVTDAISLSVTEGRDGRVLLRCHAGCEFAAIVAAIGLQPADLAPAREGEVRHSVGDPARAADLLGFRARVPFEAGITGL